MINTVASIGALLAVAELSDTEACFAACSPVIGAAAEKSANPYCRALCDNASHAIIALLAWHAADPTRFPSVRSDLHVYWAERVGACACGSLVDLDHFLAVRSFSLADATHPPGGSSRRPPFHALISIMVLALAILSMLRLVLGNRWARQRYLRVGSIICCSLFSHQLRDSTRRGFWLWPLSISTTPTSRACYRLLLAATPLATRAILTKSAKLRKRADSENELQVTSGPTLC